MVTRKEEDDWVVGKEEVEGGMKDQVNVIYDNFIISQKCIQHCKNNG